MLCGVGLLLSADLMRLHVAVHADPDYESYCSMGEGLDCAAVAQSEYSIWLGMPLALWGILAYLTLGALGLLSLRDPRQSWPIALAWAISVPLALSGIGLFWLSHYVIHSVCIVCAGTYLINFLLVGCASLVLRGGPGVVRRAFHEIYEHLGATITFSALGLVAVLIVSAALPEYWAVRANTGPDGVPVGATEDGHAWIGAAFPELEVTEFSDYECPHCRSRHAKMRELVAQHPDKIRLVHMHYPLDNACNPNIPQPFHENACLYARMANCAARQDRFWEANDYLYANHKKTDPVTAERLARDVDLDGDALAACLADDAVADEVARDMAAGRDLGVQGTPTFVVDGQVHPGWIPPEILDPIVQAGTGPKPAGDPSSD